MRNGSDAFGSWIRDHRQQKDQEKKSTELNNQLLAQTLEKIGEGKNGYVGWECGITY